MDVHKYKQRLKREIELIEEEKKLNKANKKHLKNFCRFMRAGDSVRDGRTAKNLGVMRRIGKITDVDFKKAKKKDIEKILIELNNRDYSEWTLHDYKAILKKFYQWLYGHEKGEYPDVVKWVKVRKPKNHQIDVFSKKEVKKLINATTNIRDKAFFYVPYDAQSREGELLSALVKDVEFKENGGIWITLKSYKSGEQSVKLYESASYLSAWLKMNQNYPENKNGPLWHNLKNPDKPLSYARANKIFHKLCEKTGVNKRHEHCKMHMFRKSRTTHLLDDGLDSEFVKRRGRWSPASRIMETTYGKVTQKSVADKMDQLRGIKKEEKETEKLELCQRCNVPLDGGNFCANCGHPVDIKADIKAKKDITESIDKESLSNMAKNYIKR